MLEREAAPAQLSASRIESRHSRWEVAAGSVDENLVPVDTHVGNDAYVAARTQKLARKIHDDSLRASHRNADVLDHSLPVSLFVFYLQRRQRQALTALR